MRMPKWFLFALLILANLIWSASFPATTIATREIGPTLLTMTRLFIGGLVLLPFLIRVARRFPERVQLPSILRSALLGLIGFTLPVTLETVGIHVSTPALGAVSIALEPLLTLLVSAVVLHVFLGRQRWLAMGVAAIGAWFVGDCPRPGVAGYVTGDILLVSAVLCYAFYNALSARMTQDVPPTAATSIMLLAGGFGCIPLFVLSGHHIPSHVSMPAMVSLLYLSLFATAGAYLVWLIVLQDRDVSSATISLYLQPIFGVLLSIVIVHTQPAWSFYVGSVFILGALYLGRETVWRRDRSRPNKSLAHLFGGKQSDV